MRQLRSVMKLYVLTMVDLKKNLWVLLLGAWLSCGMSMAQNRYLFPEEVAPLTVIAWAQWFPYSRYCPTVVIDSTSKHVYAGCAPLAMSQYMRTLSYPSRCSLLKRNYDWSLMPYQTDTASYTQQHAVARLIRDCGIAARTNYQRTASSTKLNDVVMALKKYFSFSRYAHIVDKANFRGKDGKERWNRLIFNELKAGRPVIIRGQKGKKFAHVFLIDGCKDSLVHVNFGWGGKRNDYFDPDTLYGFTTAQRMVIEAAEADYQPCIKRIIVEKAGQLHRLIEEEDWTTTHHLKITGLINAKDIALLRQLSGGGRKGERSGQVATIDLTETAIMALPDSAFFSCSTLTYVSLPAMLPELSNYAFANCPLLNEVNMHGVLRTIGRRAFSGCFCLWRVNLPKSLRTIGANAFNSCNSLTELTLPSKLQTIESGAFAHCTHLTSLTVPKTVRIASTNIIQGTKVKKIKYQ